MPHVRLPPDALRWALDIWLAIFGLQTLGIVYMALSQGARPGGDFGLGETGAAPFPLSFPHPPHRATVQTTDDEPHDSWSPPPPTQGTSPTATSSGA